MEDVTFLQFPERESHQSVSAVWLGDGLAAELISLRPSTADKFPGVDLRTAVTVRIVSDVVSLDSPKLRFRPQNNQLIELSDLCLHANSRLKS